MIVRRQFDGRTVISEISVKHRASIAITDFADGRKTE